MKRLITLVLLLSIAIRRTDAGPLDWIKRQFRDHPTRTAFVIGIGAAAVQGAGVGHCRQGNVENCQAKYGPGVAAYLISTGANFTMIAVSDACGKNGGGKFCNLFRYSGSAAQIGFGIQQWRAYAPNPRSEILQHRKNLTGALKFNGRFPF